MTDTKHTTISGSNKEELIESNFHSPFTSISRLCLIAVHLAQLQ